MADQAETQGIVPIWREPLESHQTASLRVNHPRPCSTPRCKERFIAAQFYQAQSHVPALAKTSNNPMNDGSAKGSTDADKGSTNNEAGFGSDLLLFGWLADGPIPQLRSRLIYWAGLMSNGSDV